MFEMTQKNNPKAPAVLGVALLTNQPLELLGFAVEAPFF